ncbi:MAG TPA: AbrB/MazE/SpoVT family DNA-binding domain-containing protein [Nanoarchaeota archaeon]|nr:AbrB/MazE/SpoVT family DNA-binding domain-containing protein [Nanoarchaeota archaeon]
MRESFGLKKGSAIIFEVRENEIILKPFFDANIP